MKLFEVMGSTELQVQADDDNETVLVDPQTNVRTVIPKDPNKPGMIKPNERGEFELNTQEPGEVDRQLKVGDRVRVNQ